MDVVEVPWGDASFSSRFLSSRRLGPCMPSRCVTGCAAIPIPVEVTARDALRSELLRCLQNVLRTQGDVRLESVGVALTLAAIATEQTMSDGEILGYLVYAGGYQPAPCASALGGNWPCEARTTRRGNGLVRRR